jgi:hypothetical protein
MSGWWDTNQGQSISDQTGKTIFMKGKLLLITLFGFSAYYTNAREKKIDWYCPYISYFKYHWSKSKTIGLYILDAPKSDISKYDRKSPQKSDTTCDVGLSPKQIIQILGKPTRVDSVGANAPKRFNYIYTIDTKNSFEKERYYEVEAFFSAQSLTYGISFEATGLKEE